MDLTIGRLCKALGLNAETVRHYREYGLLHPRAGENGYFTYDTGDLLSALLIRELRSQDLSLPQIKDALTEGTMEHHCRMLDQRRADLEAQRALIDLHLSRLDETQVYTSCGVRILNGVEEFDGPPTWAVGVLDRDGLIKGASLEQWSDHLPFTYVSATITLDQLERRGGREPYHLFVGAGALEKYVQRFRLPLPEGAFFQSGGHFIRTCIAVEDIFSISPHHIAHLLDYADRHRYRLVSHTGGRLLFIDDTGERPLYYVLIWVRADPSPK